MLMITKVETPDVITLKLEGRLVGLGLRSWRLS
jgi:hypothetical protein